jgi:hypothetical protein
MHLGTLGSKHLAATSTNPIRYLVSCEPGTCRFSDSPEFRQLHSEPSPSITRTMITANVAATKLIPRSCREDGIAAGHPARTIREAGDVTRDRPWSSGCRNAARRFAMQITSRSSVHDPDGVPHEIVGLTWVFALGVGICAFAALTIGGVVSAVALLLVPGVIVAVGRRAERKRGERPLSTRVMR